MWKLYHLTIQLFWTIKSPYFQVLGALRFEVFNNRNWFNLSKYPSAKKLTVYFIKIQKKNMWVFFQKVQIGVPSSFKQLFPPLIKCIANNCSHKKEK